MQNVGRERNKKKRDRNRDDITLTSYYHFLLVFFCFSFSCCVFYIALLLFFLTNEIFYFVVFMMLEKKKKSWHLTQNWFTERIQFSSMLNSSSYIQRYHQFAKRISKCFCFLRSPKSVKTHFKMFRFSVASLHKCRRMFFYRFFAPFALKNKKTCQGSFPPYFQFFSKKNYETFLYIKPYTKLHIFSIWQYSISVLCY